MAGLAHHGVQFPALRIVEQKPAQVNQLSLLVVEVGDA